MRVIGIDPSLTSTGLALVVDGVITEVHCVKSSPTGDSPAEVVERLVKVAEEVCHWVWAKTPDLVVIESASFASKFGKPHERAGLFWFIVQGLGELPLATVAPQSRAKYGTGKGNAPKAVVYAAVKANYQPLTSARISNNDIADAVLLAAMGARACGVPVAGEEPGEANLASLTALYGQVCK